MIERGISRLLTFNDSHFDRYTEIAVLNPFDVLGVLRTQKMSPIETILGGDASNYCNRQIGRIPFSSPELVNEAQTEGELEALRRSVQRACPFGDERWQKRTAERLGLESTLRPRGRPRKKP
jgi:hypothetical protein